MAVVAVAAMAFSVVFRTRLTPVLLLSGSVVLTVAAALLLVVGRDDAGWLLPLSAALCGSGAGATVAPGLFQAALSMPSRQLGPAFALVELLSSEAAFLIAPVLLHVAEADRTSPHALATGVHRAAAVLVVTSLVGLAISLALPLVGGLRLQRPHVERWVEEGGQAIESAPVGAAVRE